MIIYFLYIAYIEKKLHISENYDIKNKPSLKVIFFLRTP